MTKAKTPASPAAELEDDVLPEATEETQTEAPEEKAAPAQVASFNALPSDY